jgi:hypothetical protein
MTARHTADLAAEPGRADSLGLSRQDDVACSLLSVNTAEFDITLPRVMTQGKQGE